EDTKARIDSGRKYVELLKQKQNDPMPFYEQVVSIYAANTGILEGTTPEKVRELEAAFLSFLKRDRKDILDGIEKGRELTDEIVAKLDTAIKDFRDSHAQFYGLAA